MLTQLIVYIAAVAPDADETSQSQQDKFAKTNVFSNIEVADGRVWMKPEGISCFVAKRMGAKTTEIESDHVPMLLSSRGVS